MGRRTAGQAAAGPAPRHQSQGSHRPAPQPGAAHQGAAGAGWRGLCGAQAAQGIQGEEWTHQTAKGGDVCQDSHRQTPEGEGDRRPDRGRLLWLGGARGACASVWPARPRYQKRPRLQVPGEAAIGVERAGSDVDTRFAAASCGKKLRCFNANFN